MKKAFILIFFIFLFSCGKKVIEVPEKSQKKVEFKKEKSELKAEEKDPLLEAMKLLVAYKKNPSNEELKLKVCDTFKKLEKKALKEGNFNMAKEYGKISSLCSEEKIEIEEKKEGQKIWAQENGLPLKVSLSNFDIQISGLEKAKNAEEVLIVLDKAFMEITSELSLIVEEKIKVILYTDREFYDLTGLPPWIGGAYDGRIHLPLANANPESEIFKKVIKHELTHAILHNVSGGRCPTWLHEGLAQYMEGESIKDKKSLLEALEEGKIPPLNSPSFLILEREKSLLLYGISLVAVNFLKERSSMGSISSFLKKIGEGETIEDSFYESFLFPYDELTERIKEYLKIKI